MSGTVNSDAKAPVEKPNENLSKVMGQLSVKTDDSDTTSKSPKNLSDMPVNVVGLIIERSDYKEQLILQKTSKSLRELVDKQEPALKELWIYCDILHIECHYNDQRIIYTSPRCKQLGFWKELKYRVIVTEDYEKVAFDDLSSSLKNPKLKLEVLFADFEDPRDDGEAYYHHTWGHFIKFREMLKSIGHQVSTRRSHIKLIYPSGYSSFLSYLKPGVLENITVRDCRYEGSWGEGARFETAEQVMLLDQWKQAKELKLIVEYEYFPMKYATHFKRLHINVESIHDDMLIHIRDCLSTFNNLEYCLIEADYAFGAEFFCGEVGKPAAPNERTKYVSHYSIPDSNDYLEFLFFESTVEIRKMKRS